MTQNYGEFAINEASRGLQTTRDFEDPQIMDSLGLLRQESELWMEKFFQSPFEVEQNFENSKQYINWLELNAQKDPQSQQMLLEIDSSLNVVNDNSLNEFFPIPNQEFQVIVIEEEISEPNIEQTDSTEVQQDNLVQDDRANQMASNTRAKKLKNFLVCLKRVIMALKRKQLDEIKDPHVQKFTKSEDKANKLLFENLFKNEKARGILTQVFLDRGLHRELQLSVMSRQNRRIYLAQLQLMKKALIRKTLPNL